MKLSNLVPEKIFFDEDSLYIKWKDQHHSQWNLLKLRKNCPCAHCRGVSETNNMSKHNDPKHSKETSVQSYQTMGRYALQIKWRDGHDTGIYTYSNLKKNCECDLCQENS